MSEPIRRVIPKGAATSIRSKQVFDFALQVPKDAFNFSSSTFSSSSPPPSYNYETSVTRTTPLSYHRIDVTSGGPNFHVLPPPAQRMNKGSNKGWANASNQASTTGGNNVTRVRIRGGGGGDDDVDDIVDDIVDVGVDDDATNITFQDYNPATISPLEQSSLPEWFDESSPSRTAESYIATRENVISQFNAKPSGCFVTINEIVSSHPSLDEASAQRLSDFLVAFSLINKVGSVVKSGEEIDLLVVGEKRSRNDDDDEDIEIAILASKKKKTEELAMADAVVSNTSFVARGGGGGAITVDWENVAQKYKITTSNKLSAEECKKTFEAIGYYPEEEPLPLEIKKKKGRSVPKEILNTIIQNIDKNVLASAMSAADNTQAALLASVHSSALQLSAASMARSAVLKSELAEIKMMQIEARLNRIREIEELCDVEIESLARERRELYGKRCRFWLGE